jgi:uncharacterized phage protein (TIGR01671 family)
MRTIKFRGRTNEGNWVFGDLLTNQSEILAYKGQYSVDKDTIGQFTGLLDKNGKEIYEGDIIEGQRYRHVIRYEEKETAFMAVLLPEYSWVRNDCHISQEWVIEFGKRVVGNIHDNPELLEALREKTELI